MKEIDHTPFAVLIWLLLLVCCVTSAHAQPARGESMRPEQPGEDRRRSRQSAPELFDPAATQTPNSVRVKIRQSASGTSAGTGPTLCEAFSVDFTMDIPPPSGVLIPVVREPNMREAEGYYMCDFLIPGLPLNQEITINASVDEHDSPTSGWRREISDGTKTVSLTESEPRVSLSFEMVYVPRREFVEPRPRRNRLFETR